MIKALQAVKVMTAIALQAVKVMTAIANKAG
jgi:hypothetical protein